jgi:hypothetical protein
MLSSFRGFWRKSGRLVPKIGGGHLENRVSVGMTRGDSEEPTDSFCRSTAPRGWARRHGCCAGPVPTQQKPIRVGWNKGLSS